MERLTENHPIRLLAEDELNQEQLAAIITSQLKKDRYQTTIDLNGVLQTLNLIETL